MRRHVQEQYQHATQMHGILYQKHPERSVELLHVKSYAFRRIVLYLLRVPDFAQSVEERPSLEAKYPMIAIPLGVLELMNLPAHVVLLAITWRKTAGEPTLPHVQSVFHTVRDRTSIQCPDLVM